MAVSEARFLVSEPPAAAPRRTPRLKSLGALTTARKDAQSPDVDPDEGDTAESVELPGADLSGADLSGADLSGEELTMPVIPKQAGWSY